MSRTTKHLQHLLRGGQLAAAVTLGSKVAVGDAEEVAAALGVDISVSAKRVVAWWSNIFDEAYLSGEMEHVGVYIARAFRSHPDNQVVVDPVCMGSGVHVLMQVAGSQLYVIASEREICVYDARSFGTSIDECRNSWERASGQSAAVAQSDLAEVLPSHAGVGPRFG